MNTSTLLSRPLLLLLLAVSWAAAVPLQAVTGDEHLIQDPEAFLKQHPSVAQELYPHLLNAASDVTLFLEREAVQDVLRNYLATQSLDAGEALNDEEHERSKRDVTVSTDVTHNVHPGGNSLGASATLNKDWNDHHSTSATVGMNRETINGLGSSNTYSAGGRYNYSPNNDFTISAGARRDFLPGGSTNTAIDTSVARTWDNNRHSLSGGLGATRHNNGFDSYNSHRAEVNYNYSPNRQTTFSIGGHSSRSPFGRNHGLGATFTHYFG